MAVTVRRVEGHDRAVLLAASDEASRRHHEERIAMQDRGEATYLVAWRGEEPCGRATVFHRSKYDRVRDLMGDIAEVNALEATPRGEGIGTSLLDGAIQLARTLGAPMLGLAVEHGNARARSLYERLGFRDWGHGEVVDRWTEVGAGGMVVREHADACTYLLQRVSAATADGDDVMRRRPESDT